MTDAVVPIVRRALEPFDIDVVVAGATALADSVASLNANNAATDGNNDAYVFIVDAISNFFGGGSVGDGLAADHGHSSDEATDGLALYGIAAADDLLSQTGNNQDEVALTFSDTIFDDTRGVVGTAAFNQNLAHRIAYTATHEAFHTFSFVHTVPAGIEGVLSDGDVIKRSSTDDARENPFVVSRFPLSHDVSTAIPLVAQPDNYLLAANDQDVGLRDDDDDMRPNLAYVTGTGSHDLIQLLSDPADERIVNVIVTPFVDAARTTQVQRNGNPLQLAYDIRIEDVGGMLADTEGTILVDSSLGNDRIEIAAGIAADFRIRTLLGDDEIVIIGDDVPQVNSSLTPRIRSLIIEGEAGDDTLIFDYSNGDPLPLAGVDFAYDGGLGTDRTQVIDPQGVTRRAFFVGTTVTTTYPTGEATIAITAPLADAADTNISDGVADSNSAAGDQITLRAAVQEANVGGTPAYVFLPNAIINLSLAGVESSANAGINDLDITGNVTIIGAGAGRTVIDASGLSSGPGPDRRAFTLVSTPQASPRLALSGVTVRSASNPLAYGGNAIYLEGDSTVEITGASIVSNSGYASGAAIRQIDGSLTIRRSVFTNNATTGMGTGGAIYSTATGLAGVGAKTLTIGESVFALNSDPSSGATDNVRAASGINRFNLGNNLSDDVTAGTENYFRDSSGNPTGVNDILSPTPPDYVVTSIADVLTGVADPANLSFRSAVIDAMADGALETIWLPAWTFRLDREGAENGSSTNDLDIMSDLNVVGVGAGLTVINTGGLSGVAANDNHAFYVGGATTDFGLSRVTVTSGQSPQAGLAGTAVAITGGASVTISDSAMVNNSSYGSGVAVRSMNSNLVIQRSVFTNNANTGPGGMGTAGAVFADGTGSLTIGDSVFALNSDPNSTIADNVRVEGGLSLINQGRNFSDEAGSLATDFFYVTRLQPIAGMEDHRTAIAPTRVVTSVADSFSHYDDAHALSLREAIDLENQNGQGGEVWLPAWNFVLTRDRGVNAPDSNVGLGDLDIKRTLTIRGVDSRTSVAWRAGVVDAVFDLVGDYNQGGQASRAVNSADYTTWTQQFGQGSGTPIDWDVYSADGNDDGVVDASDYTVWNDHNGNTFDLFGFVA